MNKQSNTYTAIYIIILVLVVGVALAMTALSLSDKQKENVDADKMRQILAAANITATDGSDIKSTYEDHIVKSMLIDSDGNPVDGDAFSLDVATQIKLSADERKLPVFVCQTDDGDTKYILPMYGAGLWGPIWGYIAVNADGATIYGAYFAHQGETPGLGAEIEKPHFSSSFIDKSFFKEGEFMPVEVVKAGQKPANAQADYVNGISGGTITSKGVNAMIGNCISPYKTFLESISDK